VPLLLRELVRQEKEWTAEADRIDELNRFIKLDKARRVGKKSVKSEKVVTIQKGKIRC
jgi:hypothetical protein